MQDPEPNSGKMSGLKLDQIKGILKSEGEENVFEIGASLVLDPGQSIRTTESEDGSAVVINDQLVKAKEDLTKAITDESDRAIAKEGEIEANLADAVSDLQEDIDSNVADLEAADKAEAEARESADKSIMATAAENKSELNDKIEKTKEDLTTALTEGDAAIQKQIDFILEGSTEKLDQVVEIVQHIENIDVENDASLASAVASLTATDVEIKTAADELAAKQEADNSDRKEEIESLSDKQSADNSDRKAEIESEADRAKTKEAAIEANLSDAVENLEEADKSEAEAREAGDKELFVKIDETKAELSKSISDSVDNLEEADKAEEAAREAGDKALDTKLDETKAELNQAIENENDRARSKEAEIEANLSDAVDNLEDADKAETEAREKADKAETEAREAADKALDSKLDETKAELNKAIEDLTTENNEEHAKRSAEIAEGDAAIQKQIDFILEGSTEKLDQVVEIVQHIENIDVENDASLASAVASLTATDIANKAELTKFIEDEITGLNEELEANVADLEAADKALDSKLDETKAELNQAIENENDRATTKEAEIEANLADAVKDLEDADKAETEAREDADKAETEAREKADKSEAEAREAGDKELFVKIDETKAELNQAISTAVSQAVQNEDFTQDSISLLGKSVGETVSFEVSGNAGVVLVFANGLYVPSTTSFDEEGEKTTVSFEMFFEGGEDDFAHFMTVDFS